jgi:phosphoribosylanthranilate isomerase
MRPRVKICCIGDVAEMRLAVRYGAAAVGLVSAMLSGPGVIADELIAEVAAAVPPGVASVLLTCRTDVEEIVEQQRRLRVNTLQLCDRLARGTHRDLKAALPGVAVVQVIHVRSDESVAEALAVGREADALLLDSGNQQLAVKELGGTGRTHDWNLSRRIVAQAGVPVFLAGGLRAENVRAAVAQVGPYGLDVCSGVRTEGRLDERKLAAFFAQLN